MLAYGIATENSFDGEHSSVCCRPTECLYCTQYAQRRRVARSIDSCRRTLRASGGRRNIPLIHSSKFYSLPLPDESFRPNSFHRFPSSSLKMIEMSSGTLKKKTSDYKSILKKSSAKDVGDTDMNGSYQKCVDSAFGSDELTPITELKTSPVNDSSSDDSALRSSTLPRSAIRNASTRKSCIGALLPYQNCVKTIDANSTVKFKPFTLQEKVSWIANNENRGFIRVFDPMSNLQCSVVVPCIENTTAKQIALKLGVAPNDLHMQLNGELIRRLDPFDKPLAVQNNYLDSIGFDHVIRRQELGDHLDLGYLIRFFAGRPTFDDGFGRQPLSCYCHVRKGRVFHQWSRRLCVLNSSRLLIYPDLDRSGNPEVVILSRAKVEEIHLRSKGRCIKVSMTSSRRPAPTVFLAFDSMVDMNAWLTRCVKAAAKIPPISDLSNLQLECLPEQVFCVGSDRLLTQLNLKHNALKERPSNEDMFSLGWLDDLTRFQSLRSLNLSDNDLGHFPAAVLQLPAVTELVLAGNKLTELPPQISKLRNLQILNVQNNLLSRLPCELSLCEVLASLDLSFNRFSSIPEVITRLKSLEHWVLSGNGISQLPTDTALACMGHVKKIELRHCHLRLSLNDGIPVATLPYLTQLDIRDNSNVSSIDLRSLHSLQMINCQRCNLTTLQLNGTALTYVYASKNKISNFVVMPVPRNLKVFDVSRNNLTKIPEWLTELSKIEKIVASHNRLLTVPHRLFTNVSSLKHLQLNHNDIKNLPAQVENCFVEVLLLHHNQLTQLPTEFLASTHKLKILNLSQNLLTSLPPLNPFLDLNKVQQLFLSCNQLGDDVIRIISGYRRLRVLDIAYNLLRNIDSSHFEKLQLLEEINVSRNKLISLPQSMLILPKLTSLRAHSNRLTTIPDFSFCENLKVLDVAANRLEVVDVRYFLAPQLKHLDVSCNPRLQLNTSTFQQMNSDRLVSLIDMNREIQAPHTTSTEVPWQAGFSETSGERNKLCISQMRHPIFDASRGDALFGMIDGGLNNEIPLHLQSKLPQILKAERKHPTTGREDYAKYSLLMAHRSLQSRGQKLGASCTLCHVVPEKSVNEEHVEDVRYTLHVANCGHTEAVLCRKGTPIVLTKRFMVDESRDEYERVRAAGSIVTEDNEINGITQCSRLLGCNFLYPAVIPEPHTCVVELGEPDEFILIASRGLWDLMDYAEAVKRIRYIPNPILAAKHLQDVVQSYGFKENLSILVVRFFFNTNYASDDTVHFNGAPGGACPRRTFNFNLGQAVSALDIADSFSHCNSDDDEIKSEPLGRKVKEQPNYYFEYKKKLKELMLDDSSSCTHGSVTSSLSTLVPDEEHVHRFDDGYQSSEPPTLDLDDVDCMHEQLYLQPNTQERQDQRDGLRHESDSRDRLRLDPVFLTSRNSSGSDGSSSSSGLGTIPTNSPSEKVQSTVITSTGIDNSDEICDSKLRFQLARQLMIQKLHFAPQLQAPITNNNNRSSTRLKSTDKILNADNMKSLLQTDQKEIDSIESCRSSVNWNHRPFGTEEANVKIPVRNESSAIRNDSPIYDTPSFLHAQTTDTDMNRVTWRRTSTGSAGDRRGRCYSMEMVEDQLLSYGTTSETDKREVDGGRQQAMYIASIDVDNCRSDTFIDDSL